MEDIKIILPNYNFTTTIKREGIAKHFPKSIFETIISMDNEVNTIPLFYSCITPSIAELISHISYNGITPYENLIDEKDLLLAGKYLNSGILSNYNILTTVFKDIHFTTDSHSFRSILCYSLDNKNDQLFDYIMEEVITPDLLYGNFSNVMSSIAKRALRYNKISLFRYCLEYFNLQFLTEKKSPMGPKSAEECIDITKRQLLFTTIISKNYQGYKVLTEEFKYNPLLISNGEYYYMFKDTINDTTHNYTNYHFNDIVNLIQPYIPILSKDELTLFYLIFTSKVIFQDYIERINIEKLQWPVLYKYIIDVEKILETEKHTVEIKEYMMELIGKNI